jgi:hypothetical protein
MSASGDQDAAVAALLAENEIRKVLLLYCRGVDRLDRDLVRACFHEDAVDSHGNFEGDVDSLLDWMWGVLTKFDTTMHFVGNMLIEVEGDLARAETYGVAFHRGEPEKPHRNLINGFRYVDRFERRDGAWRIARRTVVTDWTRVDVPEQWWPTPEGILCGTRGPDDPVYEPLR